MDYKLKWDRNLFWLLLALGIILLPNIYLLFKGLYFEDASIFKKISFVIISISLVLFPLVILKPKHYLLIAGVFVFLVPFEIISIYIYGSGLNAGIIIATINTSIKETAEFVKLFFPFIILGIIIITSYLLILIKKVTGEFILSRLQCVTLAVLFFLTIIAIWLRDIIISHNTLRGLSNKEIVIDGTNNFTNKFSKIFPFSSILQVKRAVDIYRETERYKEQNKKFKFQAVKKDTLGIQEKYLLIIGESSRKNNYQLYGYQRETNPLLDQIQNLDVIKKAKASSNLTTLCFPLMLTRATPQKFDLSIKEKTFISAFKECGFKTYWISNQGVFNSSLARFCSDISKVYNLNNFFDLKGQFDDAVFSYVDSVFSKNEEKQLIVINLVGSHFCYNLRYPQEYDHYKPCFEGRVDYLAIQPSNKEKLMNTYDNSILYTDFILSTLIKKVEKTNSLGLLLYLSDHGENLYDDSKEMFGHGNNSPSKYEIEIPFLVWHSDKYDSIYKKKILNLKNNSESLVASTNVFHSLIDGANITYRGENLSKSIFSSEFKDDSVHYILLPNKSIIEL